jgi:hypothetical protein
MGHILLQVNEDTLPRKFLTSPLQPNSGWAIPPDFL